MEKYPTRNELLNYVVRIRHARTLEFMKVDALLKKYPEIYSRIALEYKTLKRYTHYDIDIKMVNSMVNKKLTKASKLSYHVSHNSIFLILQLK